MFFACLYSIGILCWFTVWQNSPKKPSGLSTFLEGNFKPLISVLELLSVLIFFFLKCVLINCIFLRMSILVQELFMISLSNLFNLWELKLYFVFAPNVYLFLYFALIFSPCFCISFVFSKTQFLTFVDFIVCFLFC